MRNRWWAVPVLAAAVIGLAACGSSSSSSSSTTPPSPAAAGGSSPSSSSGTSSASSSQIKTASTSVGTVLVNSKGFVIYWFAIDTATKSNCNGSCATYWPPVQGPLTTAAAAPLRPAPQRTIKPADSPIQGRQRGPPQHP